MILKMFVLYVWSKLEFLLFSVTVKIMAITWLFRDSNLPEDLDWLSGDVLDSSSFFICELIWDVVTWNQGIGVRGGVWKGARLDLKALVKESACNIQT